MNVPNNAAPLYRVQITTDDNGKRRRLHFLTLPRDEFGWPLAKMTVELLRWGSLLANHEKAAEAQGLLLNVVTGGDPDEQRRYGDWLAHDQRYERTGEFLGVFSID